MEEMETDGDEEMLMMSKQPSMTMLNEREVSAGAAPTRRKLNLAAEPGRISRDTSLSLPSAGFATSREGDDSEVLALAHVLRRDAPEWQGRRLIVR